ncbi:UNKNOWN [Stylonychia lemnae]|uniref:SBF1/SBF2 domain-containing protein n=1 Tax=Stylonychia lemnae TaxID=5949 RepID=A0A078AG71_STYLE|nr:UNKNOWN [Stylonychia lemnae]|eukprot:CDW81224.1 UNKNOWN [Stylonychia lemnae]
MESTAGNYTTVSEPTIQQFAPYWNDCREQMNAMEKLYVVISEILQCEKSYEISLRRIGMHKHDILGIGCTSAYQKQSQTQNNQTQIFNVQYQTAVQSLQNFCLSKADQIKRTSLIPVEQLGQSLSELIRRQDKHMQQYMNDGSSLVSQLQNICQQLTNRNLRGNKNEGKQKKEQSLISKIIGGSKSQNKQSQSYQDKLVSQSDQLKKDQDQIMADYQKVVKDSYFFRTTYAIKMTEILEQTEKTMRLNIESVSNCIIEYANMNKQHNYEMGLHIDKLHKKQKVIDFSRDFQNNQSSMGHQSPTKSCPEIDQDMLKSQMNMNQFLMNVSASIDKLILQCWDGIRLRDEEKNAFRMMIRHNQSQLIFINLLNQFRIKNIHSMNSDQAIMSISELIKIVLDEIINVADTYVAVNCLLLSSTFYYNPASQGGQNTKKFLYELILDHRIWQDIDFWERAITQQIQKDLNQHTDSGTLGNEDQQEKAQRFNEVVFAILSSLQQEMLTYNIQKDIIKALVNKICKNTAGFPDIYLHSMLSKIDDYVQQPQQVQIVHNARLYMSDPQNDPLFEEQKKSNRNSISPLNTSMMSDTTARKISEMSSISTIKDEVSRTPSPKLSPKADQGSKNINKSIQKTIEDEQKFLQQDLQKINVQQQTDALRQQNDQIIERLKGIADSSDGHHPFLQCLHAKILLLRRSSLRPRKQVSPLDSGINNQIDRFIKKSYLKFPAIIRLRSNPGDGVDLSHVFKIKKIIEKKKAEGVSDSVSTLSYQVVNGTTLNYSGVKDVSQKLKLGNTSINYEVEYEPSEHNNDDRAVQVKHLSKYEPGTGKYDNTESLKVGVPKVGPLRPWFTLDFNWNNLDTKRKLKNSLNFQYNDYHLGYKLKHDLNALQKIVGVFALKNHKGDFFFKADGLKQHFTLGCNHSHHSGAKHSMEVIYDHTQKLQGVYGQPLALKFAGEYDLSSDLTLKTTIVSKKETVLGFQTIHRVNKNFRFVFSDVFNLNKAIFEPKNTNYNFGLLLEFTL